MFSLHDNCLPAAFRSTDTAPFTETVVNSNLPAMSNNASVRAQQIALKATGAHIVRYNRMAMPPA
jgi:hypothetical protein